MSLTNFLEAKLADHVFGAQTYTPPANLHIALHSAFPNEAGAGAELSGAGYARVQVVNNLTNWPAYSGDQKQNGAPISFPQATGNWLEAVALSVWDAATSGNMLARTWMGSDPPKVFVAEADDESFNVPGHSLAVDDRVAVIAMPDVALPTGVSEGVLYWVKTVTGNLITLSATQGGATLALTTDGTGLIKEVVPKIVQINDILTFPIGSVTITLD